MADQGGPSTTPEPVVEQQPEGSSHSFSEALLWAQASDAFDASDACSGTSTFQALLPELSSSNSCGPSNSEPHCNDLLSSWIANYMATGSQPDSTPAAVAEPSFMNADLDTVPSLLDWNTSSFDVTKPPPPTLPKWMSLQAPGPDLPLQHSPGDREHSSPGSESWRAEPRPISPSPEWNNSVALGLSLPPPFPVQRGVYQTGRSSRRELFRPHSAPASTLNLHYHSRNLVNMQPCTANAFGVVVDPHHAPVAFLAPGNYANFHAPMLPRPSWLTPIGSWSSNDFPACNYNNTRFPRQEMMLPMQTSSERPYSSELSRLLPVAAIATAPPPLLTSFGSCRVGNLPSWFPRPADGPLPSQTGIISHAAGFQSLRGPGESSTSRKRSNFAIEDHSSVQWPPGLAFSRPEWGSGPSTVASREVMALGPALNTNGKPRASRGSATDPQSVYARYRREKITERMKTLQGLVPNGSNVDIVTMLDEAHDYVMFLEHQIKLLKSDENWKSATPSIYKGIDLSKPQPPKPSPGR